MNTIPEKEEIRIRKLFRENKELFFGDIADVAFLAFYHKEIFDIAREYGVTLMIHKPYDTSTRKV